MHLICLVTLIINIYGLGVGISTIKKFTSGRGWVWPWGLSYNAFNLPIHPDHKYIWFRVGISVTFFLRFPSGVGLSSRDKKCWMHNFTMASPPIPNIKFLSFVVSEKCVILKICTFSNNSVIMLPTKNYVDRPKTKSAIALTKIILKICTFSIKKHDFTRKKQ